MATLAGFSGRDLFSGPSPLQAIADRTSEFVRQQKEEEANEAFSGILIEGVRGFDKTLAKESGIPAEAEFQNLSRIVPGGVSNNQIKNLRVLGKLDPAKAQAAFNIIRTGQAEQIANARAQVKKRGLIAIGLRNEKDPQKRAQMAVGFAESSPNLVGQMSEFLKMSPESQEVFLDKSILEARTFDEVLKTSLQPIPTTKVEVGDEIQTSFVDPVTLERGRVSAPRFQEKPLPGFTLSPGQRRFGPSGEQIASVEEAPQTPEQRTSLAKNLELAGIDPRSPEGIKIITESITKPGVKIDLNKGVDFKIPNGFMLDKKNGKILGIKPIPGGPKDTLTGENAAKAQMLRTAQKAAKGINKFVFDEDGTLNRTNLFNASFGTPGTAGRELRNKMEFGIQGITRSETGAAMPESEVDNTRERFMPSVFDSVATAKLKLQMFNEFIGGTLKLLDPTGRFASDRFNAELVNRGGEVAPSSSNQPQKNIVVDF
jgi:hypothetical protein